MVQVSADPDTPGAIRVEFLEGDPLVVTVRDGGALLDALKVGSSRATSGRCAPTVGGRPAGVPSTSSTAGSATPVHTITPAIDLLNAQRKGDGGTETTRSEDPAPPRGWPTGPGSRSCGPVDGDLLSVGGSGR